MRWSALAFPLLILLVAGPIPGVVQSPPPYDFRQIIRAERVNVPARLRAGGSLGSLRIVEAWRLRSPNSVFGGFSALAQVQPRQFLLASDVAVIARFGLDRSGDISNPHISALVGPGHFTRKSSRDMESLTIDVAHNRAWAGFEWYNSIWRFDASLTRVTGMVHPRAMRDWLRSSGPEAMTMLPDGRLLVLSEASPAPGGGPAAGLFAGDPVDGAPAHSFAYRSDGIGKVTDAAMLPDGRVLILHRSFHLLSGFRSALAIADPAQIRPGRLWTSRVIARFAPPLPNDNFEGISVEPAAGGAYVWMVSDDNFTNWQQTLLLKLFVPLAPREAAGQKAAGPRAPERTSPASR